MKQIPLREFQLHPTKYIKELPLVITQYNLPIAKIIPFSNTSVNKQDDVTSPKPQKAKLEEIKKETGVTTLSEITQELNVDQGHPVTTAKCQIKEGCRAFGQEYKITYIGDEGEITEQKYLCDLHVKKARQHGTEVVEV